MGLHHAQLLRQWSDDLVFFTAGAGPLDDQSITMLSSRNVRLEARPVTELVIRDDALAGLRVAGGEVVPVDAVFTAATLRPHDDYLADLGLERADTPVGSFISADATGKTSNARIWAAGNITSPMANVPVSMAAGTMAGAMVNMDLVTEDFALAAQATAGAIAAPTA
jgi:thioredoxin reductase